MAQRPTSHTDIAVVHGLYHVTERRGAAAKRCVRDICTKLSKAAKTKKLQKRQPDTRSKDECVRSTSSSSTPPRVSGGKRPEPAETKPGPIAAASAVLLLVSFACAVSGDVSTAAQPTTVRSDTAYLACVWSVLCRQLRIVISHFLAEIFTSPWTSFEAWTRTPQKRLVASSSPHTA
jgi:hypothetical protein